MTGLTPTGCGLDKAEEQRVRTVGAAFEFGVELAGGEPRVLWQFDDLDEPPIRGQTGRDQPAVRFSSVKRS